MSNTGLKISGDSDESERTLYTMWATNRTTPCKHNCLSSVSFASTQLPGEICRTVLHMTLKFSRKY